jgi:class 3 adenylate cyclase/tetratricopeptide (TPR) repeat protein
MPACPRCGEENSERARFCSACGAPLAAEPDRAREVRKTVTVVFSDVIGSTALGEARDPESMRRVMSRYFDEARSVHERHGGTVEKFIGDAVMAVFGIPRLHEDDALRAVRAATELRERLAELNEELERDWGVRLQLRTGVNTGEVVAGDASGGQQFATGDAVNVAKRFEQAAQPDEVLLGEATYRLVRDAVTAEPVEPLALKGKEEPVAAYRLLEVSEEPRGTARRLEAPLVGREHELTLLEQAYARVVRERASHLFTLLGPAGQGKSRLAAEMVESVAGDASVLVGRCLPYGEGITFWPVAEIVRQAAGLRDDDGPGDVRAKIGALLGDASDAAAIAERVVDAIGLEANPASSEETFWGLRKLLEAVARDRPLVVVLDDLHWAEPTLLDFVEHVADWSRDAPILLLCLARAELLDQRSGWGGGKLNATSILLEPLSDQECGLLIENLLGPTGLPTEAQARIAQAAEGNPLFVEEMLGMLVDDGLLRRHNGGWVAEEGLTEVAVPPTIQALLAARLDRLEGSERDVIERASVEGKVFHRGAILELAPEAMRVRVPEHLLTLQRKELIRPSRSDFAGDDAFRFRHLLIRDAAYDAIPKQLRAELHERFAAWLEGAAGERAREYEEILGYHLEQAYRYRSELGPLDERAQRLAERASAHLAAAGRRASAREDVNAARTLFERAVALLPEDDAARLPLLPDLGEALAKRGEFDAAEVVLTEAIERADSVGERGTAAHARVTLVGMRIFSDPEGRTDEALRVGEDALPIFRALGDNRGLVRTALILHWVRFQRGQSTADLEELEKALPYALRTGDIQLEAELRGAMRGTAFWGPAPYNDLEREFESFAAWAKENGLRLQEMWALGMLAHTAATQARFAQARELLERAREIGADLGSVPMVVMFLAQSSGYIESLAGDDLAAERSERAGYEQLEAFGELGWRSTLAGELAHTLYDLGRYDEAGRFADESRNAAASDDVASQSLWRGVRAKLLAIEGDLDEAERLAREGVRVIGETECPDLHGLALLDLAEVMRLAERPGDAAEALREALSLFSRKGNLVMAERTRGRLSDLTAS